MPTLIGPRRALLLSRWTPAKLSGLKLWLDAGHGVFSDAGTTPVAADDPVQQWNDLSGNGNHVVQATIGLQPLYKVNIVNGKPVIRFDGVDDSLRKAGQIAGMENNKFTVVTVGLLRGTPATSKRGLFTYGANFTAGFTQWFEITTPKLSFNLVRTGDSAVNSDGVATIALDTPYIWAHVYDQVNISGYVNSLLADKQTAETSAVDYTPSGTIGLTIGSSHDGTNATRWLQFDLQKAFYYNRNLSLGELAKLMRYVSRDLSMSVNA